VKVFRERVTSRSRPGVLHRLGELRAVASGPGLVPVILQGITPDGRPYVARHWSRLPPLSDELTHGPLPAADALRMAVPVARALAALHAAGLVHGNVCPANVLLLASSSPALADAGLLGLAGLLAAPADVSAVSSATAPEDVCALGQTLVSALLAGSAADSERSALLPEGLPRLLAQLTTGEPRWRPTAGEALEELRALAGEQPGDIVLCAPPEPPPMLDEPPPHGGPCLDADVEEPRVPTSQPASRSIDARSATVAAGSRSTPAVAGNAAGGTDVPGHEPQEPRNGAPSEQPGTRRPASGHRRLAVLAGAGALAALAVALATSELLVGRGNSRVAPPAPTTWPTQVRATSASSAIDSPTLTPPSPASSAVAPAVTQLATVSPPPPRTPSRVQARGAAPPSPDPAAPALVPAPVGLAVAAGNGGLIASWSPPAMAAGASPIVSYDLTVRRVADGATETVSVPVVNPGSGIYQPVPGLANNLAYTVTVTAVDQGGRTSAPVAAGPVVPRS
jgi:hypothetical protein